MDRISGAVRLKRPEFDPNDCRRALFACSERTFGPNMLRQQGQGMEVGADEAAKARIQGLTGKVAPQDKSEHKNSRFLDKGNVSFYESNAVEIYCVKKKNLSLRRKLSTGQSPVATVA